MPHEEWKRERVRGLQLVSEAHYRSMKDNYGMCVFIIHVQCIYTYQARSDILQLQTDTGAKPKASNNKSDALNSNETITVNRLKAFCTDLKEVHIMCFVCMYTATVMSPLKQRCISKAMQNIYNTRGQQKQDFELSVCLFSLPLELTVSSHQILPNSALVNTTSLLSHVFSFLLVSIT